MARRDGATVIVEPKRSGCAGVHRGAVLCTIGRVEAPPSARAVSLRCGARMAMLDIISIDDGDPFAHGFQLISHKRQ
jgi:proline racemase